MAQNSHSKRVGRGCGSKVSLSYFGIGNAAGKNKAVRNSFFLRVFVSIALSRFFI
jgi:hypothetical protein